jgi:hypothetical protein
VIRRNIRGAACTASAAIAALFAAASCDVYDSSLLGDGSFGIGTSAGAGNSGAAGAASGTSSGGDGSAGRSTPEGGSSSSGAGGSIGVSGAAETNSVAEGGASGSAGDTEMAGGSGSTGTGGTGGDVSGAGGSPATTGGCAKLTVPLNASNEKAHFVISLTSPVDLSSATITMRLYVASGSGGTIFNYVQDSTTYHFFGTASAVRPLLNSFSGWSTATWNVGAQPDTSSTGIVKTSIKNIGIEINAQPSFSWSDPTVVYIDSITVTAPKVSITFDASSSVVTTPTTIAAPGQALWINSGSTDTTAIGTTVAWQANCP